jgi:tetratricopeptide (TPR) repeat protein
MNPTIGRRSIPVAASAFPLLVALLLHSACQGPEEGRRVDSGGRPATSDPHGRSADPHAGMSQEPSSRPSQPGVDPNQLPLTETGSGSVAELERARSATQNAEAAECLARGFRLIFTTDKDNRDYGAAKQLFLQAVSLDPNYAEAYRGLAYAEFNLGFNREAALLNYKKALELKPNYGEAHYALAFLYAMDNLEEGGKHFSRAMELGVADERNLRDRFYPEVKIETH